MLYIREAFVDDTEGHHLGGAPWYETFTDDPAELFWYLKRQYGNARNMYVDCEDSQSVKIGWVFTGRDRYEDSDETYKRSVWVEVSTTEPVTRAVTKGVSSPWR